MPERSLIGLKTSSFMALACAALMTGSAWCAAPEPSQLAGELVIGGTGAALGTMQKLTDEFRKIHPGIQARILPSLGSGGGIKALMAGQLNLSVSARPVTDAERSNGLVSQEIAKSPLVFATGMSTPVSNVTLAELAALYSGKTAAWPDGTQVRPVLRPAADVDTLAIREMSPALEQAMQIAHQRDNKNIAVTDTDSADTLESIPGAIGTSTLALIRTEHRKLKILSVNGVNPSIRDLANKKYPFQKPVYSVTRSSPSAAVRAFILFVNSPQGASILTLTGNIPAASAR